MGLFDNRQLADCVSGYQIADCINGFDQRIVLAVCKKKYLVKLVV